MVVGELLLTVGVVVVERDVLLLLRETDVGEVLRDTDVDELLLALLTLRVVRVEVAGLPVYVLWLRPDELSTLADERVERLVLFVTVLAFEELRLDAASPLNEALRPVVLAPELLRLETFRDDVVVLRLFMADEEA